MPLRAEDDSDWVEAPRVMGRPHRWQNGRVIDVSPSRRNPFTAIMRMSWPKLIGGLLRSFVLWPLMFAIGFVLVFGIGLLIGANF